jgi:hypothetical protein
MSLFIHGQKKKFSSERHPTRPIFELILNWFWTDFEPPKSRNSSQIEMDLHRYLIWAVTSHAQQSTIHMSLFIHGQKKKFPSERYLTRPTNNGFWTDSEPPKSRNSSQIEMDLRHYLIWTVTTHAQQSTVHMSLFIHGQKKKFPSERHPTRPTNTGFWTDFELTLNYPKAEIQVRLRWIYATIWYEQSPHMHSSQQYTWACLFMVRKRNFHQNVIPHDQQITVFELILNWLWTTQKPKFKSDWDGSTPLFDMNSHHTCTAVNSTYELVYAWSEKEIVIRTSPHTTNK